MRSGRLLFPLLLFLSIVQAGITQERVALLVGIGDYGSKHTALTPLQARTGVHLMERALLDQGFRQENILIIQDSAATRQTIKNAFATHLSRAGKGGVAFFHFYGHGNRVPDDNGDETDGVDEAFLVFPSGLSPELEADDFIRDDELGQWVRDLQRQLGTEGQIVTILDACHSGSGLRGDHTQAITRNTLGEWNAMEDGLSNLVVFYSSRPDQPSLEVRVDGNQRCALMTWAFCKAMAQMGRNNTYRGLFERTLVHMTRKSRHQIPELEGDPDQLIFGAPTMPPPPYFRVLTTLGNREILLNGGTLYALTPGSRIALHAPETREPRKTNPLATAEVMPDGALLTECRARLSKPLPENILLSAWAFPEKRNSDGTSWSIHAPDNLDDAILHRISDHVKGSGTIQWCSLEDAELILLARPGKVSLRHADGTPSSDWIDPYTERGLEMLGDRLDAYAKGQFLRGLQTQSSDCNMTITCGPLPVDAKEQSASALLFGAQKASRRSVLGVRNSCQSSIYYTLIDIDPLNRVRVLAPAQGRLASEYRLEAGEQHTSLEVNFEVPGTRIIKLIASPEPIDLRGILGAGSSHFSSSDVERMIDPDLFWESSTRGESALTAKKQQVGVSTLILEVR